MIDIAKFVAGFERFQEEYFGEDRELFVQLAKGQNPKVLIVACVDPVLLTAAEPGDVFVVCNVANLVPPYEPGGSFASVRTAPEFAICSVGVEQILLGHAQCGRIRALMGGANADDFRTEFIGNWVGIARSAHERVRAELPSKPQALQERACEQAAILVSLENLMTSPWTARRAEAGTIHLHGWYFDIAAGALLHYEPARNAFDSVTSGAVPWSGEKT
jgi:carbonic anhydrase